MVLRCRATRVTRADTPLTIYTTGQYDPQSCTGQLKSKRYQLFFRTICTRQKQAGNSIIPNNHVTTQPSHQNQYRHPNPDPQAGFFGRLIHTQEGTVITQIYSPSLTNLN